MNHEMTMDVITNQPSEYKALAVQADRDELIERLAQVSHEDAIVEPLDGIRIRHASSPTELGHGVSFPALCVVAQGSKEVLLGGDRFRYDPSHFLIVTTELPIASQIIEASEEQPYLGVVLRLDPLVVGSVMVEADHPAPPSNSDVKAIDVSPLDTGLLDAVVRLVRLVESPVDARFLAPLVIREIAYRLLVGEQGGRLRHIAALSRDTNRIANALERPRRGFDQPLRVEDIARELGMSVSSFHHHFKAVTAMSPLQFQKQLRLQEARRLMLSEGYDATTAGFRVGYDDASHFNREYKRLFGAPPMRDMERLQNIVTTNIGL